MGVKLVKTLNKSLFGIVTFAAVSTLLGVSSASASSQQVLDLSEWQGTITLGQAKLLKQQYKGVILRVQYGSTYKDKTFTHNAATLQKASMKYGVYSYSMYLNSSDARQEARDLHARAPKAIFYANDAEQYTVTSGSYSAATAAWGSEMQRLTQKPVVLYSGNYFYGRYIGGRAHYDATWLAAYGSTPTHAYDMHQYTDHLYVPALGKSVDGNRSLSKKMQGYFKGNAVSTSKYTVGGRKLGEQVRVKAGAKFYGTKTAIAKSLTTKNLTIKQVKTVYTGKSKQVVLVYNGKTVIGWLRAQDVTAYYRASYVKNLRVTDKAGIYTYLHGKRAHRYKKGAVLAVSGFKKNSNGIWRSIHAGHNTTFTANKNFVKWLK